jgi:acyl-CoA thioester hydrolase
VTPPTDPSRPLFVELDFVAQSYDIDFMGIVSNIVYVRWLEDLRLRLLELYHPLADQLARGYTPVLARTEISYKHPVRIGESVEGQMWVSDLGRARWTLGAELRCGRHLAASATQVGYFWNLETRRTVPVPEVLADRFASWSTGDRPPDDPVG